MNCENCSERNATNLNLARFEEFVEKWCDACYASDYLGNNLNQDTPKKDSE